MSNYNDLVEFRNKLTNDTDCIILEEDCQLLDRVLDDYEQKDQRIAELEKYNAQLEYWKSYWYNSYDEIRNKYNKNQQEKRTAVKEFAKELVGIITIKETKNSELKIEWEKFLDYVRKLLKERGIE